MDVSAVIAVIGGVALLVGIFGGGVKIKEAEIPTVNTWIRVTSAITGIILITISIFLANKPANPTPSTNTSINPTDRILPVIETTPTVSHTPTEFIQLVVATTPTLSPTPTEFIQLVVATT